MSNLEQFSDNELQVELHKREVIRRFKELIYNNSVIDESYNMQRSFPDGVIETEYKIVVIRK